MKINGNLKPVDGDVVRKRAPSVTGHATFYIVIGIMIGWSAAHYFVNINHGEWPNASFVGMFKPKEFVEFLMTPAGLTFLAGIIGLVRQLFYRKGAVRK